MYKCVEARAKERMAARKQAVLVAMACSHEGL